MLSKIGKLLLFLYFGIFILKSLPKEMFLEQTKASKVLAYIMILFINGFMIGSTICLLLLSI
jgi:hypothetical protein